MTNKTLAISAVSALFFCGTVMAEETQSTNDSRQDVVKEIEKLTKDQQKLNQKSSEYDQRIRELEKKLNADEQNTNPTAAAKTGKNNWGPYEPGKGFVLARNGDGEIGFSLFTYVRYLNQQALDDSYTDAFGRTFNLDLRNDVQLAKVNMSFKGWLFDPKFRFLMYTWTSNTSQGDPAQVVVAGNLGYQFNDTFQLYGGIGALPSTRSMNYTFPNWLKNDHRTIADEYFRGSYTSGFWASGQLQPGLKYRAMIGNNLSQLGVNAAQLDDKFNTVSAALWWMPTTGEYGPGEGLGDYENHPQMATLFSIHFTSSREDAQGQPGTDGFENSQIRLSDGTRIFSTDPFGTGGDIRKATYAMMAVNGGFKLHGYSVEAEFYIRRVDEFQTTGPIPVSELNDTGFQIQGSTMVVPKSLQVFLEYSRINGEYGHPSDATIGVNWFPFKRKEVRLSAQGLYLNDSPVGYSSVPFAVGGNGWVFSTDLVVAF